jgi:hypothetical protein
MYPESLSEAFAGASRGNTSAVGFAVAGSTFGVEDPFFLRRGLEGSGDGTAGVGAAAVEFEGARPRRRSRSSS